MGQSAGGHPEALSRYAGQLDQIPEPGGVVTLREQAHAGLGDIGQLARRRMSKILPIPHRARLFNCYAWVKSAGGCPGRIAGPGTQQPRLTPGSVPSRVDRLPRVSRPGN